MSRNVVLFVICFFSVMTYAQVKHAFVVSIGDYPYFEDRAKNWKDLSSANDLELVKDLLVKQAFQQENTTILQDKSATAVNVHRAFDSIIQKVAPGDVFFFHFSGHGQQVMDADRKAFPKTKYLAQDELDLKDEALVLYNAPLEWLDNYTLDEHFVDDQMNYYITAIRNKIGATGQVFLIIDACHSGSATRGAEARVVRGTKEICAPKDYETKMTNDESLGFDGDFKFNLTKNTAPMVAFFGCKAEQVNSEISAPNGMSYGSLTYFFTKSLTELKENASYQNLFSKVNEKMILAFRNDQQPVMEGDDLNSLLFNGGFIPQSPFFKLMKLDVKYALIDGGMLNGVQVGDSIGFYSNTTSNIKDLKPLFSGIVSKANAYQSEVQFTKNYSGKLVDSIKYRAFITSPFNPGSTVKLKLEIESKSIRKEWNAFFKSQATIQLTDTNFDYLIKDSVINGVSNYCIYLGGNLANPLQGMSHRSTAQAGELDWIMAALNHSSRIDVFRKLNADDSELKVKINMYPCIKDCFSENPIFDTIPAAGNFQVKENSCFKLIVQNESSKNAFINILDIDPTNVLVWLDNDSHSTRNYPCKPNKYFEFIAQVYDPYGSEQFKVIASDRPMSFSQLEENGKSMARGVNSDPLFLFVDEQTTNSRGSTPTNLGATIQTLHFEIIK